MFLDLLPFIIDFTGGSIEALRTWVEMVKIVFDGLKDPVQMFQDLLQAVQEQFDKILNTSSEGIAIIANMLGADIDMASNNIPKTNVRRGIPKELRGTSASAATTNNSVAQQNTINISGSDPKEIGKEVRKVLESTNRQAVEALAR